MMSSVYLNIFSDLDSCTLDWGSVWTGSFQYTVIMLHGKCMHRQFLCCG